jgi:shikimate 5-dehydrogenase
MLATDGVSLSQATVYENGDVMTKDGHTFFSQQAIKQFRNATDTDPEEDN